jgi:ribosomal protein S25
MFKELWARIKSKQRSGEKLTRKEQILAELSRDIGTAKQIADRSGVKLSIVRTTLSQLRKAGKIKDTGVDAGSESVWEVVK